MKFKSLVFIALLTFVINVGVNGVCKCDGKIAKSDCHQSQDKDTKHAKNSCCFSATCVAMNFSNQSFAFKSFENHLPEESQVHLQTANKSYFHFTPPKA